ncbi:HD-GYP domain-containing protein [Paenibacillus turpanensis]|uniref:HD-GYP domain-containing protein n=1 Tax=Paenibacillus turpanensis TaxID=2689078 RepID=UPI001408B07F|nr:HD domain-containing phosphohydrolase [Paenibacillus turpanensis]
MRYLHIDNVEPGQYLGKTIYSANGAVLLNEGVQLTVYMISTLRRIGVTMIYIRDKLLEDVTIENVVSDETKQAVMRKMGETFDTVLSGKEFSSKQLGSTVDNLIEEIMRNRDVLVQLTDIISEDNAMYIHAVNVCMMSVIVGLNLKFNANQLKELALGALLHDIGKIGLEEEDKADKRKMHTWRGFEYLKNKREYSLLIAHVAFQHHEHVDGSGTPRNLIGDQIHIYAKIVAIANLFDNLVSGTAGRKRMPPHEACEYMMSLSGTELDPAVLAEFFRIVSIYPTGTSVKLTTKEIGVIVGQHRGLPGRPIVRVIKSSPDDEVDIKEVDLAFQTTVFIDSIVN